MSFVNLQMNREVITVYPCYYKTILYEKEYMFVQLFTSRGKINIGIEYHNDKPNSSGVIMFTPNDVDIEGDEILRVRYGKQIHKKYRPLMENLDISKIATINIITRKGISQMIAYSNNNNTKVIINKNSI